MLKPLSKLTILFFILFLFNGCRKDILERNEDFFNNGCKISSFKLSPALDYTLDYNTPGILKGHQAFASFEAEFNGGKLLRMNVGNLPVLLTGSSLFEYGVYGLAKVTFFTNSFYGLNNNIDSLDEMSKVEFKYNNQLDKPISMSNYSLEKSGISSQKNYRLTFISNLEFDQMGNLTKEITFILNSKGEMQLYQTSTHQYDRNINSCRQLNYLFFDWTLSPAYIFSENNKIFTQTSYGSQNSNLVDYKMIYDSQNHLLEDGSRFSKIIWACK